MSAANEDNLECLVRFCSDWHRLALLKMRQLQDDGMTCAEIVLEHPSKGTAHIDRWGKVTWDDELKWIEELEADNERLKAMLGIACEVLARCEPCEMSASGHMHMIERELEARMEGCK